MGSFAARMGGGSSGSSAPSPLSAVGINPDLLLEERPDNPQGVFGKVGGFLANIPGDVVEIGQGLNALVGIGLSDLYKAGADVAEFPAVLATGKKNTNRAYNTDELAKALVFDPAKVGESGLMSAIAPGIQEYTQEAYGVDLTDILPDPKKIGHSLYHNPLQSALDVYGGAALGGRAIGKSALRAAKRGERTPFVKKVLPGLDPDSPLYDPTGKYKGGVKRTLIESGTPRVIEKPQSFNPVKRGSRQWVHNRLSQDIENLPDEIKSFADDLAKMDPETQFMEINALAPEHQHMVRLYQAAKKHGVTRLEHEPVAKLRLKMESAKKIAGWTGNTYRLRNEDMKRMLDVFENSGLDEVALKNFHKYAQGLEAMPTPGRRSFEELEGYASSLDVGDPVRRAAEQLREYMDGLDDVEELEAVRTYAEDLSEITNLTAASDPIQAAVAKLRVQWHELQHEAIQRGLMGGYRDVMARQYGPLLIEDNMAMVKTAGSGFSFDDLAAENSDFWKIKRDEFRAAGRQAPIYFPHLDPRKFKASEFTLRRGMSMEKMTGRAPFKRNQYRNYIQGTYLKDDPVEVYARRIAHTRRIIETQKFVEQIAQQYGRPITRMDEIVQGVEAVFNPKALKQIYRTRGEIDNAIAEYRMAGQDDTQALASALKDVEDKLAGELPDAAQSGLYAIPKSVADKLESYSRYQIGTMGRLFVDAPTNAWRTTVLSFSPRWLLNNLLGNITFLKLQGGKLSDVVRDFAIYKKNGELKWAFDRKHHEALNRFIDQMPDDLKASINSGLYSSNEVVPTSLGAAGRTATGALMERGKETRVYKKGETAAHKMQHWNSIIERHFRRTSALRAAERQAAEYGMTQAAKGFVKSHDRLERLMKEGISEADAHRFVDEVNYFFNDYRKLSSFERNVVRRFLMPFYSFYKHSARLMLSYPIRHPERALAMRMLGELAQEMDHDLGAVPEYVEGAQPIGQGAGAGETRFLNARNANPLGGFTESLRDPDRILSMAHPLLKGGYEYATGKDTLTGRPFSSPGATVPFGSDQQYKAIYDDAGGVVGVEPTTVRPNPLEMIGRQVPQFDIGRDLISMVPGVGEPGVGERYSTGEEKTGDPESMGQEIGQWLGLSTTDVDVGQYQEYELANRKAALTRILRDLGHLPEAVP